MEISKGGVPCGGSPSSSPMILPFPAFWFVVIHNGVDACLIRYVFLRVQRAKAYLNLFFIVSRIYIWN
jgi:hypothetical protein